MIRAFLTSFNLFCNAEIKDLISLATTRSIKKGDFLIHEGSYCKEIAFVHSGVLRSFILREPEIEITHRITFPNSLITAYSAFITGEESKENIQAITHAELLIVQKSDLDKLAGQSINWTQFLKMIAEQQYITLEKRTFLFQRDKARETYLKLINDHPDYIRQIPLPYLASYLGITQRQLSQLKKDILF